MTALDRLTADPHPNDRDEIGTEDGDTCNRYPEPDEDQPRGYRPRRCSGEMEAATDGCGDHWLECDA